MIEIEIEMEMDIDILFLSISDNMFNLTDKAENLDI